MPRATLEKRQSSGLLFGEEEVLQRQTYKLAAVSEEEVTTPTATQHAVQFILYSTYAQVFLSVILLVDVLILFTELFLMSHYPLCNFIERDAVSCCRADAATAEYDDHHRFLAGDGEHHGPYCSGEGLVPFLEYDATCDDHKWEKVHNAEKVLFIATIIILTTFFVHNTLELIAMTPRKYCARPFFVMDYFVIAISLTLDLTFYFMDKETFVSLIGLLALSRVWRFVRIGHGIATLTADATNTNKSHLHSEIRRLKTLLEENDISFDFDDNTSQNGNNLRQEKCSQPKMIFEKSISKPGLDKSDDTGKRTERTFATTERTFATTERSHTSDSKMCMEDDDVDDEDS